MKNVPFAAVLAALLSLAITPVSAQDTLRSADYQLQPLGTRYARTATKITFNSSVRFFHGVELQEANAFDGYTVDLELTVPFWERFQLRLYYPAYTDGDARLTESGNPQVGEKIDIDGDGGIFDFPSAIVDYQFKQAQSAQEWNLAAFAGYGYAINELETSPGDVYNHQGNAVLFGLKGDRELNAQTTALVNLGGRYYYKSDDLNPAGNDDVFAFMDASVAFVYDPSLGWVYPALELIYQGDLGSYNTFRLDPQLIFPVSQNLELKAGGGIGLTSDGESWQARLQAVIRY